VNAKAVSGHVPTDEGTATRQRKKQARSGATQPTAVKRRSAHLIETSLSKDETEQAEIVVVLFETAYIQIFSPGTSVIFTFRT
jgi:hypothetical protein